MARRAGSVLITEHVEEGDMAALWGGIPSQVGPIEQSQPATLATWVGVSVSSLRKKK